MMKTDRGVSIRNPTVKSNHRHSRLRRAVRQLKNLLRAPSVSTR